MEVKDHPSLIDKRRLPFWYTYIIRPIYMILLPVLGVAKLLAAMIPVAISSFCDFLLNLGTDPQKPLDPIRLAIYKFEKQICYRLALLFAGIIVIKKGKDRKDVNAVVVNHTSSLDILLTAGTGIWSSISKAGIAKNPLFGPTIRVTRSYLARAGSDFKTLANRLTGGFTPLGVFPGGTTTNQRIQPRYRTGIFIHKPRVQIATIKYYTFENIFYGNVSGPEHVFNIMKNPLAIAVIEYHPEVYTHQENEEPQDYANRIGTEIAKRTNGVYTMYNFKDLLWFNGADEFKEQLSEVYKQEQLWRGNNKEWKARCDKAGLNYHMNWTKADLEAAEKKMLKAD